MSGEVPSEESTFEVAVDASRSTRKKVFWNILSMFSNSGFMQTTPSQQTSQEQQTSSQS